ncbi:MAG: hypothetical protein GY845_05355 [Planctomycetes bacterium]|nr:hypothetical protein [Planctomycetota bacterium]
MAKLRLLPDVPFGEGAEGAQDGLRFGQYATILARAALDTPEPFTIGVYGGWGSGKTSLMRMVMNIIEKEDGAIGVWFNAWRYEKEEHLIIPLLATIITEMNNHESEFKKDLKAGFTKLRDAFRGILYGVSVKGKISIPGLSEAELSVSPKDMVDRYEKLSQMASDRILDQSLYFRSFGRLDELARSAKTPKIIIFVDDLDRCFPDKAVALLESIKLVLNQPNITFVLGIAPKIIRAYLTAKYKKDYDIHEDLYEDYLDKLVQLPFPIPEIKQSVSDYVRSLLKRENVFGKIPKKQFQEQYEPLVSICGPACKDNPRAIIRFLNRLLILTRVHEQKQQDRPTQERMQISLVHFGITNALQMKWPSVLRACELDREIPIPETEGSEALCKLLVEIFDKYKNDRDLISEIEKYTKEDLNPEKNLFRTLSTDESLRSLLSSAPGEEWLAKPELREEAAATTEQVKTVTETEKQKRRHEIPGAESYTPNGWPVVRDFTIRPGTDLINADLKGADLREADLVSADLSGADLREADLKWAILKNANLVGASLSKANLVGATLSGAKLENANLIGASLSRAQLRGAILEKARFMDTYLRNVDFSGVDLNRADFSRADLSESNFVEADLTGTNLIGTRLAGVDFAGARYNKITIWPKGFNPEKHSMINMDKR